ncbi:MAG: hypothetical protein IH597_02005 [Bacteroidales bacterium]|nr:hypothetical protein [Bacteroidales bacterium]
MNVLSDIKISAIRKLKFLVFLLSVMTSCESENNEKPPDFRDDFVGTYTCMETFTNLDPTYFPYLVWITDTVGYSTMIITEKHQDSSLNIIIGSYSFIATFEGNNTYTCLDCNGPPDYARFFNTDSIFVYQKYGVTARRNYLGKKLTPAN